MSIECWATLPDGTYVAHLERSEASPFRHFAVSRTRGSEPAVGSLEYNLDNAIVRDNPGILADNALVWMKYRGRTMTWVVEEHKTVLDENEHATDWVQVSGRDVRQLLADRIVWPTKFDETHLNPAVWDAGSWKTKLDGAAASGQKVVPVTSTVGAVVGDPVEIVSSTGTEVGIIASINAGVSVTLVDNLAGSFAAGDRICSAAKQWRRFVNRAAGEMLWDLIVESNPRFATQILRGTIETTGADGWTQDLRFDNLGEDVVADVVATFGEIDMDGLTFSYFVDPGVDRSNEVIFEEGADILRVERQTSVRDKLTWVVAEGLGEGVTAKLRFSKVISDTRRREAYVEAKDVANVGQLQKRAVAARGEHQKTDSIALKVLERGQSAVVDDAFLNGRYAVFDDFDTHDKVRVIAPSRSVDESLTIVAIYLAEDDDAEGRGDGVTVDIDVNTPRQERLLRLDAAQKGTRSSLGVRSRMPQGQLVPYSFSGSGILDSGSPLYVFVKIPDRIFEVIEAKVTLAFRQFLAPATAASSGGSSSPTSGASSASSSNNGSASFGLGFNPTSGTSGAASAGTAHTHPAGTYGDGSAVQTDGGHSHPIPHTHTVTIGSHSHALDFGTFEESYPASHSVTLRIYERVNTSWTLRGTVSGLTDDLEDVDLLAYLTGPGDWRLTIQSAGGQPNGGRLGCDVFGAVTGPIQSA